MCPFNVWRLAAQRNGGTSVCHSGVDTPAGENLTTFLVIQPHILLMLRPQKVWLLVPSRAKTVISSGLHETSATWTPSYITKKSRKGGLKTVRF